MNVLMFGWEFPPFNSGGLGVACQGLSRALSKQGIQVTFVLPKEVETEERFRFIFADNVFVEMLTVNSMLTGYITQSAYSLEYMARNSSIYGPTLYDEVMRYALRARKIAKENDCDVNHAHDWLSYPAGIEAKKVNGKPLVVHVHATEYDRTGGSGVNKKVFEVEQQGFDYADRIVTVSEFTKNMVINHYDVNPHKISVIHNGIDRTDYAPHEDPDTGLSQLKSAGYKIVLFVGRLTLQKGPDYFLKAAAEVLKFHPKTMFVIAGSGDMEGKIMQMAAQMGISQNLLFVGFLRGAALSRLYKAADIFVMPSVSEPFGITPLESLLHGTPVIMSKQSGASEVILHAMKMDFWDTDEMADKILSVIEYPSLKNTMGTNGNREALSCTWDSAAKKCIDMYNNL